MLDNDPLPYTAIEARETGNATTDALHAEVRRTDNAWRMARAERHDETTVRALATGYAKASEAYQRARFGSVRQRISVSALMR